MVDRIKKIDGVILVVLLLLMAVSLFAIYSVSNGRPKIDGFHIKMLKYYIVGFVVFFATAFFNYKIIVKFALYIYSGGIALLGLVSLIGKVENGAQGWLKFGGLSLQPAELFKLVLILFLTALLVRKSDKGLLRFWKDIVPLGLLVLLPFLIVIIQNDLGNALSYIVIFIGLLWIGNIRFSHAAIGLAILGATAAAGIMGYIHYHDQIVGFVKETVGRDHLVRRLDPWLLPDKASKDASYHTKNAQLAIASGGLTGEGYRQGTSVQSERVPYTYADAIFVQIAEEFGFMGSAAVLLLYFILIHRMILIALECRDRAGPYIIVGIVAMLLYQIFENIGAFIGLMPLTGITLPFISSGGTSLLINMASLGLVMSIRLHSQEVEDDLPSGALYPVSAKS